MEKIMKEIFLILFILASINSYARVGDDEFVEEAAGQSFGFTEVEIGSEYIGCQFVGINSLIEVLKCMNGLHSYGYVPHGNTSVIVEDNYLYVTQIMKKK